MHKLPFLALAGLSLSCLAGETAMRIQPDALERSRDYVRNLDLSCTLTDGYACAPISEDRFLDADSWQRMVPAAYLPVWQLCYEDFRKLAELTAEQRDLRHYKIGFTENETQYVILFQGLLLPRIDDGGRPAGLVSAVFGRSVKYWVDKETLQIQKRAFL